MIYKVTVIYKENQVSFGFNSFSDMVNFLQTAIETVDGFEDGTSRVLVHRVEESPTSGNS